MSDMFFCASIPEANEYCMLADDEWKHVRAMRKSVGDTFLLCDAKGKTAMVELTESLGEKNRKRENHPYSLRILNTKTHQPESTRITLALGLLDKRDRMEFALEKATELGISRFVPLLCEHSQQSSNIGKKHSNADKFQERFHAKALSAMKQSQHVFLPRIELLQTLEQFLQSVSVYSEILVLDATGEQPSMELFPSAHETSTDIIVCVGPEGGFSEQELQFLQRDNRTKFVRVGTHRLRAETAAIAMMSVLRAFL